MKPRLLALGLVFAAAVVSSRGAIAGDTQWWISDSPDDYAKAESRGVVVRPDGVLELGPRATSSPAESLDVVWAIAVLKDGSVVLAGDGGQLDRWTERGGVRPWATLPVGQVLSLAADGDGVIAGTGPEGLVYRIGARGDTSLLARTGERYVWGLVRAAGSAWYAATGTRGRLLRIEGGKIRVLLDSGESNLVSLVSDGRGGAYAGGDSRGRVIHVLADGVARTLFDAEEDEIRALAIGADGALYAAGLGVSAVAEEGGEDTTRRPAPARSPVAGSKATVYRILPDSVTSTFWNSPQPFVYALAPSPRGVVAATGNRAGLYLLEGPQAATQWLAASQGQITALASDRAGHLYAATSNPGALWRVGPDLADRGELLSSLLDARRIARFGRIRWRGESGGGRIELSTRSGNTDAPDTAWSAWQGGAAGPEGLRIDSPAARYLQWKLELSGGRPRLESVEAAWREQNLPPSVEDVAVAPQGQGFREGDLLPRSESVTQTLPGGQRVSYSTTPSKAPQALRELPMWARGMRTMQWKGSDPNGDPLRYRVDVRPEGNGPWMELEEDLEGTSFTWDTRTLTDGRYRVRVTATDEEINPIGEERIGEGLSEPFTVDNTPPAITAFEARGERSGIRVQARAEDQFSPLSRLELTLDEGEWRTVTPEGGLADDRELSIRTLLEGVEPGEHLVSVRAVDLAGNATIRTTRVTVPGTR